MNTAVPERGEHELVLAGVTYRLRPSHQALRGAERKTERSLLELLRLANAGGLSLDEIGIVVAELIRAGADEKDVVAQNVDAERISELIYEEGLHKAIARVTLCLIDAASGGRKASGEAKAAPASETETAGAA
ncbi:MAG TPA: GTA-gp10 family protein [Sphingomonas sp.]|jgi:hypothetical protein